MSKEADANISRNIDLHRFNVDAKALEKTARIGDRWHKACQGNPSDAEWNEFLASAARMDRGAIGIYSKEFRESLPGKRVLDFGSGRGVNAVAMAAMGADVTAVDISPESVTFAEFLADRYQLQDRLTARSGDVRELDLEPASFDIVVGQNILHHLVHDLEWEIMERLAILLKPDGVTYFVELAHNWKLLLWAGRVMWFPHYPSSLQRKAYAEYVANDPHPQRDNSTRHFEALGKKFYHDVEVEPFGGLERLVAFVPGARSSGKLRHAGLRAERLLPKGLNSRLAAAQRMTFRRPRIPHLPR